MAEKKTAGNEEEGSEQSARSETGKARWIELGVKEFEDKVVELARKGESLSKIGLILRDNYGIPRAKVFGKKIKKILEEKGISYKGEKEILGGRISKLRSHIEKNKHDHRASRALTKKLWVIKK